MATSVIPGLDWFARIIGGHQSVIINHEEEKET